MNILNWTAEFQDVTIPKDIPAEMQRLKESFSKIQIAFTCGMVFCLILMVPLTLISTVRAEAMLGFSALACVVGLAGARIRTDIRLAMYRLMLEWQGNISAELRKSEAEDL